MQEDISAQPEQDELFEHHRIAIDKGQAIVRIDKFLTNRLENTSRSRIQNAADAGNILVNDKAVRSSYKIKPGDVISIVLSFPPSEVEVIPEDLPLDIVYEDDHVVVINKESGMVVHPAYGNYSGTLVNALAYHFKDLPLFSSGEMRPGLVHRIDKDTTGLLVVAKTELAMTRLAKDFFDRKIYRRYIALVWGDFEENEGTVIGNIGRNLKNRKVMDVFPDGDFGKHAVTHYKVLERFRYVSVVECRLETGRTHQIRVHMRSIKHPLFNDTEYGGSEILRGTRFTKYKQFVNNCFELCPRQALHARSIGFKHPATGKEMIFDAELPADIASCIEKWRNYSAAGGHPGEEQE
ncbi:MAG: RluA family pseudouridine synthase [Bacteroidetes bacterium]|nr:RluA family pseudouridine synthase [Bacteroidota bacterium]MBU1719385.1 RluA family pseudouridine synthase [Bacteroidota bacterium]